MTLKEAAKEVLSKHRGPMRTCNIWAAIKERGYYKGKGKTPYRTLTATLYADLSRKGNTSTFVRHGFGLYGLRKRRRSVAGRRLSKAGWSDISHHEARSGGLS